MKSKFKFLDRGFKDTLVLIPGWAADYRIFQNLDLDYNYIFPLELFPFDFNAQLLEFLSNTKEKITLFGSSLGGFLAADFAAKYPQRVEELILLSIRKHYEADTLNDAREKIKGSPRAFFSQFYQICFSQSDSEGMGWFKDSLMRDYLDKFNLEDLLIGLDYLSSAILDPKNLSAVEKIRIFHGDQDLIAPISEARELSSQLAASRFFCLEGLGHIIFLNSAFKAAFENEQREIS